jgi:hypothetical protein
VTPSPAATRTRTGSGTGTGAATGTPAWLISAKGAWTSLGTDRYPWYPQVRLYRPDAYGKWGPVLETIAADLGREFGTDR